MLLETELATEMFSYIVRFMPFYGMPLLVKYVVVVSQEEGQVFYKITGEAVSCELLHDNLWTIV